MTGNFSPLGEIGTTTMIPAINVSNANVATLCNGTGTAAYFQFTPGTLKCKDFTFGSFSGASQVVIDASNYNPSFNVSGSFVITTSGVVTTWTKGTGTITFSGSSGTQLVEFGTLNPSVEAIVFTGTGTEKQFAHSIKPVSINGTGGIVSSNSLGSRRTFTVTSSGTVTGMSFRDILVAPNKKLRAKTSCVNLGNCAGITFKDVVR
jgi:hypothetical protein